MTYTYRHLNIDFSKNRYSVQIQLANKYMWDHSHHYFETHNGTASNKQFRWRYGSQGRRLAVTQELLVLLTKNPPGRC